MRREPPALAFYAATGQRQGRGVGSILLRYILPAQPFQWEVAGGKWEGRGKRRNVQCPMFNVQCLPLINTNLH